MPTPLEDLESAGDGLSLATEHAARERDGAATNERADFETIFRALQDATQAATVAHSQLVTRDTAVRAAAQAYFDSLAGRATEVTDVDAELATLNTALAARLSITPAQVQTLLDGIEGFGAADQADLAAARLAADTARQDFYTTRGAVENAKVALNRVERRITALDAEFDEVVASQYASIRQANGRLSREEVTNDREAAVWAYQARRDSDRLGAAFDPDTNALATGAMNVSEFTSTWEPAWNALVAAQLLHHQASLALHRALLEEAIAEAAISRHETSIPFAFDAEIAAIIAGF